MDYVTIGEVLGQFLKENYINIELWKDNYLVYCFEYYKNNFINYYACNSNNDIYNKFYEEDLIKIIELYKKNNFYSNKITYESKLGFSINIIEMKNKQQRYLKKINRNDIIL